MLPQRSLSSKIPTGSSSLESDVSSLRVNRAKNAKDVTGTGICERLEREVRGNCRLTCQRRPLATLPALAITPSRLT